MTHFDRRAFLKLGTSAVLAGGLPSILNAATPCPECGKSGKSTPSETVRLGFIGLGGRGKFLLSFLPKLKNAEVTALCEVDEDRLTDARKLVPEAHAYRDLRNLLDDPNVDAVVIATCNHWHVLASIWAMQAGKDVYVEKPLCITFWEGRQLVNAAQKYGKICQLGTQMRTDERFHPEVRYFLHEDQALGKIQSVRVNRFAARGGIGKLTTPLVPPASVDYTLWRGPAPDVPLYRPHLHYDWHWMWRTGNGETGNWGAHLLDDCRNDVLRDAVRMPKRVLCGGARIGYDDAGETPNSMFVYFDTGSIPVVFCISNLPDAKDRRSAGSCPGPSSGYVVYCEGGRYEKHWGGAVAFDAAGKKIREFQGTSEHEGAGPHLQNFVDAIRERDARRLTAPIQTGYDSSFWYNSANLAYRLGEPYSKQAVLAMDDTPHGVLTGAIEDLERHLTAQGLKVTADTFRASRFLELDAEREAVTGEYAEAAADLQKITYCEPFVVPEIALEPAEKAPQ